MPNVIATQRNIGGALFESFVIPFLVPCRKVLLTPADGVPYSDAAKKKARLGRKVNFAPGKIPSVARAPENEYVLYQPRRRPNIVQSLVGLR